MNINKLGRELIKAGMNIEGISSSDDTTDARHIWMDGVRLDFVDIPDQATIDLARSVIAVHDPWEYSISPQLQIVKVGSEAHVGIRGKPGATVLTIDGVAVDITIDDNGTAAETFVPASPGEYVVEYVGNVAVIKAVG